VLGLGCFCAEQLTLAGWVGNGRALGSGLATAWFVVCLRKHAATSPLSMLLLANILVAVVGVPWMCAAMPDAVSGGIGSTKRVALAAGEIRERHLVGAAAHGVHSASASRNAR